MTETERELAVESIIRRIDLNPRNWNITAMSCPWRWAGSW